MADKKKSPFEEATLINTPSPADEKDLKDQRSPSAYPLLEIQSGPKQGHWFSIKRDGENLIGRASLSSIVLEDNSVSRSHAAITEKDQEFFIKDVGSRNGTLVNNKKVQENVLLKQGDRIKVGIYVLKFLTEPEEETPIEDEIQEEKEILPQSQELGVSKKEASILEVDKKEKKSSSPKAKSLVASEQSIVPQIKTKKSSKLPSIIALSIFLLAGVSYFIYYFHFKNRKPPGSNGDPVVIKFPTTQPVESQAATQPFSQPIQVNPSGAIPIFVEVSSQPLPAKIFYKGKELGITPFNTNILVNLGTPQEIIAVYHFEELNQDFSEKKTFTVSKQEELVPIRFEALVGSLKIKSLPKGVQTYLEGSFSSDQLKTQSVKLNEINYHRPVSLPYGKYTLELKNSEKLEGSDTVVDVVKYHREFSISKESPTYEIALTNQDLLVFPAKIKTIPSGASVFIDNKKQGETPFEGNLPLGKHQLTLQREGYHDYEQAIEFNMNIPLVKEISLKTSEAGQFINKGRELIKQAQFQQAIEQLAESLKHNPSPLEIVEVQLLLGSSYNKIGSYDVAIGYFEKVKANPNFKGRANLGIAEASLGSGNTPLALDRVVDVLVNEKDEKIKLEAEGLFRKVSPLKSVILINTEPSGAKVLFNGQDIISQTTPVLLSDIPLGSHRITITKNGYKVYETKIQLTISTFKPIIVKLEPL